MTGLDERIVPPDDPTATGDHRIFYAVIAGMVSLAAVAIPLLIWWQGTGSSASFGDAEVSEANRLGAATVDVEVGETGAVFAAENLAPGDRHIGRLVVNNTGSAPIRLGVSASSSGGLLAEWLRYDAWIARGATCPRTPPAGPAVEAVTVGTDRVAMVGLTDESTVEGLVIEPRRSAAVCLAALLPIEAPNAVQGQRVEVTLILDAEQVVDR